MEFGFEMKFEFKWILIPQNKLIFFIISLSLIVYKNTGPEFNKCKMRISWFQIIDKT
jgi:hypothetical protein